MEFKFLIKNFHLHVSMFGLNVPTKERGGSDKPKAACILSKSIAAVSHSWAVRELFHVSLTPTLFQVMTAF